MPTALERFLKFVEKPDGEEGCWVWTGAQNNDGRFGYFYAPKNGGSNPGAATAHRWAWQQWRGVIPPGLRLRRQCDAEGIICINPWHHQAMTASKSSSQPRRSSQSERRETKLYPVSDCLHYFLIEPPDGPVSAGVCKLCGEVRDDFHNSSYKEFSRWDLSEKKRGKRPLDSSLSSGRQQK